MSKKILFLLTSMIVTAQCTEKNNTEKKETISKVTESKNDSSVSGVSTTSATEAKTTINTTSIESKSEELSAVKKAWNKVCQKTNSCGSWINNNRWWTAGAVVGLGVITGLAIWALSSDDQDNDNTEEQE